MIGFSYEQLSPEWLRSVEWPGSIHLLFTQLYSTFDLFCFKSKSTEELLCGQFFIFFYNFLNGFFKFKCDCRA